MSAKRVVRAATWLGLLALWISGAAAAGDAGPIVIDGVGVYPESLTSTTAGDLIVGSSAKGAVYRARRGDAKATLWIDPKTSGMAAVLGVFADEASHTLYVCSAGLHAPPDKADGLSALRTFDLETGTPKGAYPMPGGAKALCNDIAIGADGAAYVTDTFGGRVLRLAPGATSLAEWLKDPRLAGADGIAIGGDGAVYLNTVTTGRMFRAPMGTDGAAGPLTELQPSLSLGGPDGLRSIGGMKFIQAENRIGRISEVVIEGDRAEIKPLKSGEPGITSAALANGRLWAINAKFAYQSDPALKGKAPEPFTIEPIAASKF